MAASPGFNESPEVLHANLAVMAPQALADLDRIIRSAKVQEVTLACHGRGQQVEGKYSKVQKPSIEKQKLVSIAFAVAKRVKKGVELRKLVMSIHPTAEGVQALRKALPSSSSLRVLSFRGSKMGNAAVSELAQGIKRNTSLHYLDLSRCSLSDPGCEAISKALSLRGASHSVELWQESLRERNDTFGSVRWSDPHGRRVQLRALTLSENSVTDKGAHVLCEALKHDCGLLSLDISNNNMTRKAATLFSSLMQSHPRLESVDLRGNAEEMGVLVSRLAVQHRPAKVMEVWANKSTNVNKVKYSLQNEEQMNLLPSQASSPGVKLRHSDFVASATVTSAEKSVQTDVASPPPTEDETPVEKGKGHHSKSKRKRVRRQRRGAPLVPVNAKGKGKSSPNTALTARKEKRHRNKSSGRRQSTMSAKTGNTFHQVRVPDILPRDRRGSTTSPPRRGRRKRHVAQRNKAPTQDESGDRPERPKNHERQGQLETTIPDRLPRSERKRPKKSGEKADQQRVLEQVVERALWKLSEQGVARLAVEQGST